MTAGSEWCSPFRKLCGVLQRVHIAAAGVSAMSALLLSTHACHALSAPQADTSASPEHWYGSCRVRNVEMALLSQDLADLEATDVPMPGMYQQLQSAGSSPAEGLEVPQNLVAGALVTVAGFGRQVHIMSTKTRPKKLSLLGSDGKSYNFLLKVRAPKPGELVHTSSLAVLSCCCCPHANCFSEAPCATTLSAAALTQAVHCAICPQARQSSSMIAATKLLGQDRWTIAPVAAEAAVCPASCYLLAYESARLMPAY